MQRSISGARLLTGVDRGLHAHHGRHRVRRADWNVVLGLHGLPDTCKHLSPHDPSPSKCLPYLYPTYPHTQEFGGERTYLSLHGLTHIKNQGGYSTCRGLSSSPLLLWNTYLRIDGVLMPLQPMSPYSTLKSVSCQSDGTMVYVLCSVTVLGRHPFCG